ncbi:Hpt domain-containing protein [Inhella sp.]|uniref:Hpt domain-containing protein n=1 Tax=Inhella sp. TaxID=1921806 RepID=UPI0035B237AF
MISPSDQENRDSADLTPLAWVQEEIRRTLEGVHKSLRRTLREFDLRSATGQVDANQLGTGLGAVAQQLHQVAGVLRMVGQPEAANLAVANEGLVRRMADQVRVGAAEVEAIERADFALLTYIVRRLGANPASPLGLFPSYRRVQELAQAERVHPADFWSANFEWKTLPPPQLSQPVPALDALRTAFETALLRQMRQTTPVHAAQLAELCIGLAAALASEPQASFWQLAAAHFEAQALGQVDTDAYVKRLGSRLLAQLRSHLQGHPQPADRLVQDLLFYCAQSGDPPEGRAPHLQAVRAAYGLDGALSGDYRDESLGKVDPALVLQAQKRVLAAKEAWGAAAEGEAARAASMNEAFASLGESLQQMVPGAEVLVQTLQRAAVLTLRSGQRPPAALAMEMATALLYLEAIFDDGVFDSPEQAQRVQRVAQRVQAAASGQAEDSLEPWMEDLFRRVADRQTLGSVVHELRHSLTEVERQVDEYFRDPSRREQLIPVPSQLQAMRGVFTVLGLDQAGITCVRMRDEVDRLCNTEVDPSLPGPRAIFERLATNLGQLGFLIDMLSVQAPLAKSMFRFDDASGELKALVERERNELPVALPSLVDQAREAMASEDPQAKREALEQVALQAAAADQPALASAAKEAAAALQAPSLDFGSLELPSLDLEPSASAADDAPASTALEALEALVAPPAAPEPAPSAALPETEEALDQEMLEIFLEEAAEVAETARAALAQLADDPANKGELTTVRRSFHTLKGSSRMVGLNEFGEAAWACEQLFNDWLADGKPASERLLSFSADALEELCAWRDEVAAQGRSTRRAQSLRERADALRLGKPMPAAAPVAPSFVSTEPALDSVAAEPVPPLTPELQLDFESTAPLPEAAEAAPLEGTETETVTLDFSLEEAPAELGLSDAEVEPIAAPVLETLPEPEVETLELGADDLLLGTPAPAEPQAEALPVPEMVELPADEAGFELDLSLPTPAEPQPAEALPALELKLDLGEPELQTLAEPEAAISLAEAAPEPAPQAVAPLELSFGAAGAEALEPTHAAEASADAALPDLAAEAATLDLRVAELQAHTGHEPEHEPDLSGDQPTLDLRDDMRTLDLSADMPTLDLSADVPTLDLSADMPTLDLSAPSAPDVEALAPTLDLRMPADEPLIQAAMEGVHASETLAAAPELTELPVGWPTELPIETVQAANAMPEESPVSSVQAEAEPQSDGEPVAESVAAPEVAEDEERQIGSLRVSRALFDIFVGEADQQSGRLVLELAEWAAQPDEAPPANTEVYAHALAGNAATVGFEALSVLARALEHALGRAQRARVFDAEVAALFRRAAEEIAHLLHQFAAGFLREPAPELVPALQAYQPEMRDEPDTGLGALGESSAPAPLLDHSPVEHAAVLSARADDAEYLSGEPDQIDDELWEIFEEEASDLLHQLHARLRDWTGHAQDDARGDACMRTLHTFKGGARLAGAMRLGELAHRLESAVEGLMGRGNRAAADLLPLQDRGDELEVEFERLRLAFRQPKPAPVPTPAPVAAPAAEPDLLLEEHLVDLELEPPPPAEPEPVAPPPIPLSERELPPLPEPEPEFIVGPEAVNWDRFAGLGAREISSADAAPLVSGQAMVRVRSSLLDRLAAQAGEVSIRRARMENELTQMKTALLELDDNLERLRTQLRELEVQAEAQISSRQEQAKALGSDFDPLEFDRYTRFQEVTRMLAESVNDVATVQRSLQRNVAQGEDELAAQSRLTRELQDDLLRSRMVEFDSLAERLHRVVRQAAREGGKQVQLEVQGGGIELDRGVLERLIGAFEHLLRNSVAHGIEQPAEREKAGKGPMGTIRIKLSQEGNQVLIAFSDDGAGLNLARIREKAGKLGLLPEGREATDHELMQLIYAPGFSTAGQVTELAGRGVGMDVVRAEVNTLGGYVLTRSQAGKGAEFDLRVPLTTALTQVVLLRCGEVEVAVPASLVDSVLRLPNAQLEKAYAEGHLTAGMRGQEMQVPIYWMGGLLSHNDHPQLHGKHAAVVLVHSGPDRIAIHVDEVVGNQEVVVKNLGPQLIHVPGLAGISLLASGSVALIYNPVALAERYGAQANARAHAGGAPVIAPVAAAEVLAPLILVVDDSLTVRRVSQRFLEREGYRVQLAKDGLDAMEQLAREELPDLVLSDIEMPRMDGFDLVRNLRADERLRKLPVVMITSRIAAKHREYAEALGVQGYLGKPYDEEVLKGLIRQYTGSKATAVA